MLSRKQVHKMLEDVRKKHFERGDLEATLRGYESVMQQINRIGAENDGQAICLRDIGDILFELGRKEEAYQMYDTGIALKIEDGDIHAHLLMNKGISYIQDGRAKEGVELIKKAKEIARGPRLAEIVNSNYQLIMMGENEQEIVLKTYRQVMDFEDSVPLWETPKYVRAAEDFHQSLFEDIFSISNYLLSLTLGEKDDDTRNEVLASVKNLNRSLGRFRTLMAESKPYFIHGAQISRLPMRAKRRKFAYFCAGEGLVEGEFATMNRYASKIHDSAVEIERQIEVLMEKVDEGKKSKTEKFSAGCNKLYAQLEEYKGTATKLKLLKPYS